MLNHVKSLLNPFFWGNIWHVVEMIHDVFSHDVLKSPMVKNVSKDVNQNPVIPWRSQL